MLEYEPAASPAGRGCVVARGLDPDLSRSLSQAGDVQRTLREVFQITSGADVTGEVELPPVAGSYLLNEQDIRFVPYLPFDCGVTFQARFDLQRLGRPDLDPLAIEFALDRMPDTTRPSVTAIYPSADDLPENLLRFYVLFSTPMRRGDAAAAVRLVDADGVDVEDALYRPPVELWDPGMRRLTVLLDPGRLKRGVGPNRALGAPVKAGSQYALMVGPGMTGGRGQPLAGVTAKQFHASAPVRDAISVENWSITRPKKGSLAPLVVNFPTPLDRALLESSFAVETERAEAIAGRIEVRDHETTWMFHPAAPWKGGSYRLIIASGLEDVCGNSTSAAFDRLLRVGNDLRAEATARRVSFKVA